MPKILVVEDDPPSREILERMLAIYSYTVITASDGAKGVSLACIAQPDLIIMDMGLPVLNGWQATHRLKGMPATQHIPIIALTAYAFASERMRCLSVGCDDYDTKPINIERLITKMKLLLDRSASSKATQSPEDYTR